jgi:phosphoesterase RecJ-like protein
MLKNRLLIAYKGRLLQRIEYFIDDQLAMIDIPWEEIEEFSSLYNPSMLVLEELRMTAGVRVSVSLKTYPDGKITGKIRCNHGTNIADALAGHFGGGGHPYAAGFKTNDWKLDEIRTEIIKRTQELLEAADETF